MTYATTAAVVDAKTLKAMMATAGKKDIRFYLNTLHIVGDATNNTVRLEVTDGHRLAVLTLTASVTVDFDIIVGRDAIDALKLIKGNVSISVTHTLAVGAKPQYTHTVALAAAGARVDGRVIDAKYPELTRVIPTPTLGDKLARININVDYLHDALALHNAATGAKAYCVPFLQPDTIDGHRQSAHWRGDAGAAGPGGHLLMVIMPVWCDLDGVGVIKGNKKR